MKADLLDTRLAVGFDLLRTEGTDFGFDVFKRGAENPFTACHGNVTARRDCEYAATHGTEMRGAISGPPAHNRGD